RLGVQGLRLSTSPSLFDPFGGEIGYFARVDVEDYLASSSVGVSDRHGCGVFVVDCLTGQVADEDRLLPWFLSIRGERKGSVRADRTLRSRPGSRSVLRDLV